jgi:uncharacterized delta-60 repeat protein
MYINPTFGYVFIGGDIDNYGGYPIDTVIKLNKNGSLNTSFEYTGTPYTTEFILEQSDGKVLTAGLDNRLLRRLTSTGAIDITYTELTTSGPSTGKAYSFDIQSDGKVIVGGGFTTVSGNSYNRICRVNSGGTLDTSFVIGTGFNNQVLEVKIQPDGKILAVGSFTQYSGVSNIGIVRLNSDGTIDTSFSVSGPSFIEPTTFLLQPDGKIIVNANYFTAPSGQKSRIIRLNSDGSVDGTFTPVYLNDNGYCDAFEYEVTTGKVFAGGAFTTVNGASQKGLVKINTDGTIDTSLNIGTGFNTEIPGKGPRVIRRKYNGDLYVGGFFDSYNGTSIRALVELTPTGEIFSCEVGNCYIYSLSKPSTGYGGNVNIRDCNGNLQNIVIRTTEPQYFCASQIFGYSGTLSGGTDIADECCFCFYNPGPSSAIQYVDCFGNTNSMVFNAETIISAQYITQISAPSIIQQLYPCPIVTPTPTATSTVTPTRTPTQTATPSQTGTIPVTPSNTASPTVTPTVTPTNTQTPSVTATNTPTGTVEATPTQTQTNTPSVTSTSTPTGTIASTPTMTPTPSSTPLCDCLCFTTTYETIPEDLQVRWRDCETDTITTQDISSLLQRDNGDGTFTSFLCVKQGLSYATPICVLDGLEVTCDPLTWIENGPCCDSIDCDIPCLCINIDTNISLDIQIDQVYVNGILATVVGGVMPNEPGNGTNLCVYIPAGTYTVQIDYSCSVSGQKISILDSNSLNQCNPTSTGPNTMTFFNVVMNNGQCTTISPADGACV